MKILIIASSFGPKNVIGAIRPTKFAKYLSRLGNNVHVFSTPIFKNDLIDKTLVRDIKNLNIYRFNYPFVIKIIKKKLLKIYRLYTRKIKNYKIYKSKYHLNYNKTVKANSYPSFFYYVLESIEYYFFTKRNLKKILKSNNFDYVILTYPNISALYFSKYIKKIKYSAKLIIDFRDPICFYDINDAIFKNYFIKNEIWLLQNMDFIICATEGIKYHILSHLSNKIKYMAKIETITNGYDLEDLQLNRIGSLNEKYDEKPSELNFTYAGTLYNGKRDFSPLFKVLLILIEKKIIDIDKIVFNYAGYEFKTLLKQAKKFQLQKILVDHDFMERKELLSLQLKSNIFLVSTWYGSSFDEPITGKLFEGMLLNILVIGIVTGKPRHSLFKEIIDNSGIGYCYTDNETDGIDGLYQFLYNYITGKYKHNLNLDFIDQYNYTQIVKNLHKILLNV
jgi:hypothetical protein